MLEVWISSKIPLNPALKDIHAAVQMTLSLFEVFKCKQVLLPLCLYVVFISKDNLCVKPLLKTGKEMLT